MNCGLSNLATLKAWLLPAALLESTDYDAAIAALGQGVAGRLEQFCNRKFLRTVGDVYECSADRAHVALPRFPIETVSAIDLRETLADDFEDQGAIDGLVTNLNERAGLVYFGFDFGAYDSVLRITYTGGYYFEQLEPDDGGYPTAQPSGSTALPAELLLAWQLQCEHVWCSHDKLGTAIAGSGGGGPVLLGLSLPGMELVPDVKQLLGSFVRCSLT